jgi:hypothetical protein
MDRDDLVETIRAVIEEDRNERIAHPEERERMTRFTTPEGRSFTAVTLSHWDWLKNIAWLLAGLATILGALNVIYLKMSVEPIMDHKIEVHSAQAEQRMADKAAGYVTIPMWTAWTVDKDRRWSNLDEREEKRSKWEAAMDEKMDRMVATQERILAKLGLASVR